MVEERVWVEGTVTVRRAQGLHAALARNVWEKARDFKARIRIERGGRNFDIKSIFDIMQLDAPSGTELVVRASGPDAEKAVGELVRLIGS